MTFKVWARPWADLSGIEHWQPVVCNKNIVLRATRTWVIVFGDPVFTNLRMEIYSNEIVSGDNTPKKLLYASTSVLNKPEVHTLPYGVREIYFNFQDVPLKDLDIYNFVIKAQTYAPTVSSYLAWRLAFPDPVYNSGYTPAIETINQAPQEIYFIGAEI